MNISIINTFMQSELVLIHNLDITQNPYQQAQALIEQGLLLLYGDHYTEYVKKCQEQGVQNQPIYYVYPSKQEGSEYHGMGYAKYQQARQDNQMNYNEYKLVTTLGEWAELTTQLYSLTQQIHECMKKCMSEYGCGFNYEGYKYKEITRRDQI